MKESDVTFYVIPLLPEAMSVSILSCKDDIQLATFIAKASKMSNNNVYITRIMPGSGLLNN